MTGYRYLDVQSLHQFGQMSGIMVDPVSVSGYAAGLLIAQWLLLVYQEDPRGLCEAIVVDYYIEFSIFYLKR